MFFGRPLTPEQITLLKTEREAADRRYNDALTSLDLAMPALPPFPPGPIRYDEQRLGELNERWRVAPEVPPASPSGLKRWISGVLWRLMRGHVLAEIAPWLRRQQDFNSIVVDHLNRNVAVHRSTSESIEGTIGVLRGQLESLSVFHSHLIQYLQTVTLFVDTKDRGEMLASLVLGLSSGLQGVADDHQRRWEAATARERRASAATAHTNAAVGAVIDELQTNIATVQQMGQTLKRELERLLAERPAMAEASPGDAAHRAAPAAPPAAARPDAVNAFTYVGFENKYRGSEEIVRERQLFYLPLFAGATDVLEIGCGRGEFLSLLKAQGVTAHGLDVNHEMVEICRAAGLRVEEGDALAHLSRLPDHSVGGLFAAQVAEHFQPGYLIRFLDTAYHKLRPGSRIVLETLNPACWSAFFDSYIRDVTHAWPLHPDTLRYLVMASGFQKIDVRYLSPYPEEARLQGVSMPPNVDFGLTGLHLVETFNENVDRLNGLLFSFRDYAIIGERL
ncbi:MAG: class I SAM-dependent methyltransferase [Acidobacteria bacterium]|nr:class I SAM-dependent methyltransferase [Acidobacteriota bacterium]